MKLTGTNRSFGLIALIYQCPLAILGGPAWSERTRKTSHTHLCFAGLVALARGPNPIPFRTRPLNPSAPMVLSLKAWESRSPPGLPSTDAKRHTSSSHPMPRRRAGRDKPRTTKLSAGWSSPVARQAHNLKVIGSNPIPATKLSPSDQPLRPLWRVFFMCQRLFPSLNKNSKCISICWDDSASVTICCRKTPCRMNGT